MVYTIHIHCILNCSFLLVFRILLLGTHAMGVYKAMYTPENFKKHIHPSNPVNMSVWYIHDISQTGASSAVVSAPASVPEVLGSNPALSPTHEACLRSLPVWQFE